MQSIPLKRAADPSEIARLAVFLACSDSDYCTGSTFTMERERRCIRRTDTFLIHEAPSERWSDASFASTRRVRCLCGGNVRGTLFAAHDAASRNSSASRCMAASLHIGAHAWTRSSAPSGAAANRTVTSDVDEPVTVGVDQRGGAHGIRTGMR